MAHTPIETLSAAVSGLTEGLSLSAVSRLTGLSRSRLGVLVLDMGHGCERLLDEHMRNVVCAQIEADEQWMYVLKRRHRVRATDPAGVGDAWVWSAIDPDSKLIPAHHVGRRLLGDAMSFTRRLRRRLVGTPQFNTDRLNSYRAAIFSEFSTWNETANRWDRPDWGTVVKHFEVPEVRDQGRYVPPRMARAERRVESGNPAPDRISTSHVEAQHLQFRMRNKRAARMTNAASRTVQHLRASVAMYFAHYNLCRVHSTTKETPAVAARVADRKWSVAELVEQATMFRR